MLNERPPKIIIKPFSEFLQKLESSTGFILIFSLYTCRGKGGKSTQICPFWALSELCPQLLLPPFLFPTIFSPIVGSTEILGNVLLCSVGWILTIPAAEDFLAFVSLFKVP